MSPWLTYVLIILVTFRATRLVIEDKIPFGDVREPFKDWLEPSDEWKIDHNMPYAPGHWGWFGRKVRYWLECPWCMSMWIGPAVIYVFTLYVSVPLPAAAWLVASAGTGLLANLEEKLSS